MRDYEFAVAAQEETRNSILQEFRRLLIKGLFFLANLQFCMCNGNLKEQQTKHKNKMTAYSSESV